MSLLRQFILAWLAALALGIDAVRAQDWPQWRGPQRTGAVEGGIKLIDTIPASGLTELWHSEPIPDKNLNGQGSDTGYSSPVAAGGRVFLYLNQKVKDESPFRLTWGMLDRLGCFAAPLPGGLLGKVEAARRSPQRNALKSDTTPAWASDWIARNLTHAEYAQWGERIEDRLMRGETAIDFDVLRKLAALKDKPYAKREDFERALATAGLAQVRIEAAAKELSANRKRAIDVIFCFDAATGKTLWKKEYPGELFEYGTSSTPCVVADRIYVGGGKTIYCLNTKDGSDVWQAPCPAKEVSSSPIVADGILLIQAGALCALDAVTGRLLWTRPEFKGIHASPTIWRHDGKAYAVQNCGLVELQTGKLIWNAVAGNDPSPVVAGDLAVFNGILCYRLGLEKPKQELWRHTFFMNPSTPIIYQGHLYGTKSQNGPLFCIELATGTVKWTSPEDAKCRTAAFNTPSCILVDGKILIDSGTELMIVRANPEKFEFMGRTRVARVNLRSSTPTIADGRLFIRGQESLLCYDLRAAAL